MFLVSELLHVEVQQHGALHLGRLLFPGGHTEVETIEANSVLLAGQGYGGLVFEENEGKAFLQCQSLDFP